MTPLHPPMQAIMKPPSPLLTPEQQPLKPVAPLQPKHALKTPISHPHRRQLFQVRLHPHEHKCHRFHARDFRCKRAMASPDQHTFACNSATDTSDFRMQSLKFRAFHGAADWRRQGIACETAKQSPHAPPAWRAPEGPAAVPPRGLRGLAGQRAYAPSEARSADGSRADRMARRPEIRRGNKQQAGRPLPTGASSSPARRTARPAPGTPAAPQAPLEHAQKETPTAPGTP